MESKSLNILSEISSMLTCQHVKSKVREGETLIEKTYSYTTNQYFKGKGFVF